jgi:hypothetical protein
MNVDHFPMGFHHWFSTNLCESSRPAWVTKGRNPTASPQSQTKNDAWRRRGAVQLTFEFLTARFCYDIWAVWENHLHVHIHIHNKFFCMQLCIIIFILKYIIMYIHVNIYVYMFFSSVYIYIYTINTSEMLAHLGMASPTIIKMMTPARFGMLVMWVSKLVPWPWTPSWYKNTGFLAKQWFVVCSVCIIGSSTQSMNIITFTV